MNRIVTRIVIVICFIVICFVSALGIVTGAQETTSSVRRASAEASNAGAEALTPTQQAIAVVGNEQEQTLWVLRTSDIANVDFITIASSMPIRMANKTGQGAGNPFLIHLYTFTPKSLAKGQEAPLIVFNHGGVQNHFDLTYVHIIRELIEQGYVVVAPEFRGSTGYGREYYDQIDYGGAEVDDVHDARN